MSIQYAQDSTFNAPSWAIDLSDHLKKTFRIKETFVEHEARFVAEEELNAPCSSVSLSVAARQKPIIQTFEFHSPAKTGRLSIFNLTSISWADTLAWRIDVAEAFESGGLEAVLALLRKQTHTEEMLRGQTQIANEYLWKPVPEGALALHHVPLNVQRQLRFVTRRRLLVLEEVVLHRAIDLYALMCRPSFLDLNRRRAALGLAPLDLEAYASSSYDWQALEESGLAAGLRPWVKPVRAYVKHLTD